MDCKQTVVKVDIDGVIRNLPDSMCRVYNMEFDRCMTSSEITTYDVREMFSDIHNPVDFFFTGKNAKELFFDSLPYAGAIEALHKLRDNGYKIALVTWQIDTQNKKYTLDWLDKWCVPYDDICFTRDKYMIHGDYLIDDNPEFLEDERERSVKIQIRRPYNTYLEPKYRCVDDLMSAIESVLNDNELPF